MKGSAVIKGLLVSLAVAGFCLPQCVFAAGPTPDRQTPGAIDVTLGQGGMLVGQVVDTQAKPLEKVTVSVRSQGQEVARALTDVRGYFAVRGLRGGIYEVTAAEGHGIYRVWMPGTAPPASQQGVLLIAGQDMVRGQMDCCDSMCCWLSSPWVVGAIVATAVAVPIAVHNSKRPSSP